jgi:hypothetical protein
VTFIIAKRAFRAETQTRPATSDGQIATPFEVSLGDRMIETVGIGSGQLSRGAFFERWSRPPTT